MHMDENSMKAKMSNVNEKKEIRVNIESVKKILRTVTQKEAFYFFTRSGEYTGEYATNLDNFCNIIKHIELKSVLFHFDRQDFEKWIKGTIGDANLANKIVEIRKSVKREEFRNKTLQIVTQRLSQLNKLLASEDSLIASTQHHNTHSNRRARLAKSGPHLTKNLIPHKLHAANP